MVTIALSQFSELHNYFAGFIITSESDRIRIFRDTLASNCDKGQLSIPSYEDHGPPIYHHWLTVKLSIVEGTCRDITLTFHGQTFSMNSEFVNIGIIMEVITSIITNFGYLCIDLTLDPNVDYFNTSVVLINTEESLMMLNTIRSHVIKNPFSFKLDSLRDLLTNPTTTNYKKIFPDIFNFENDRKDVLDVNIMVPIIKHEDFVIGANTLDDLCIIDTRFAKTKSSNSN